MRSAAASRRSSSTSMPSRTRWMTSGSSVCTCRQPAGIASGGSGPKVNDSRTSRTCGTSHRASVQRLQPTFAWAMTLRRLQGERAGGRGPAGLPGGQQVDVDGVGEREAASVSRAASRRRVRGRRGSGGGRSRSRSATGLTEGQVDAQAGLARPVPLEWARVGGGRPCEAADGVGVDGLDPIGRSRQASRSASSRTRRPSSAASSGALSTSG